MEHKKKQVGIWIRVSTEDQAKGESPEHHEKRARYYAESKDWEVVEVYHLEAVSGKSVMEHPETQRMLRDIRSKRITGLVFSKLARLARNTKELLDFADIFREAGTDLISLQEAIDTSTPAGRLFYTMIAAMAQWEREEIAARVAASVPIRAKLGKQLGGVAPFGYQWVDKKLIPNPQEAPVRKLIYELFLQHRRLKTVAAILNKAGYRTSDGYLFSGGTVKRLLLDPTAKGLRIVNFTRWDKAKKKWTYKPQEEWVYVPVEPIVSEEVWEQCNQILNERKSKNKRTAKRTVHLFAGLLYCFCGKKMYVPSRSYKYVCQNCRNKIVIEDMENIFHEQLKGFLFSSEEIAKFLEGAEKAIKDKSDILEVTKIERDRIRKNMDKIMKLYLADQITPSGFGEEYKPLEAQVKQIEDQLPILQAELDFLKIKLNSSDEVISEARDLYSRWSSLTAEEKRRIVENIVQTVIVGKDDITIDLYYLPSSIDYQSPPSDSSFQKKVTNEECNQKVTVRPQVLGNLSS